MKLLLIGGNGTIGRKVSKYYQSEHDVIIGSRHSGDVRVDISEKNSIRQMFEDVGKFDAIVCMAGEAKWAPFAEMSEQDFKIGLNSKLMGQVNLVRIGLNYLNPNGSITLTTGILADHPVPMTTSAAMVNGAIHSFVKALPKDIGKKQRVNVVSSGLVEDAAEKYEVYFQGQPVIPMDKVLNAYRESIEGDFTGEIIKIYR